MGLNLEEAVLYGQKLRAIAGLIAPHKNGLNSKILQKKLNYDSYRLQTTLQLGVSLGILSVKDLGQSYQYQVKSEFLDWALPAEATKNQN